VRRGQRERGGGSGGDGSGDGGIAAAKTSELGQDDERPTTMLEEVRGEATSGLRSRWDLRLRGDPPSCYIGLQ